MNLSASKAGKRAWLQAGLAPKRVLTGVIKIYRLLLSPWLGLGCRFEPSCSAYSLQAIELHGAWAGSSLMLGRLARCHPWCNGGLDPVPTAIPHSFFTRLVARATGSSAEKTAP